MPELPEVEVIRRGLQDRLPGCIIRKVTVRKALVVRTSVERLCTRLPGQVVEAVRRRGKFLLIHLSRDCLVIHLGMTGQLTFWDHTAPDAERFLIANSTTGLQSARQHAVDKHTHVTFSFEDGDGLHYRDIRQFGAIRLAPRDALSDLEPLRSLGPEPLSDAFALAPFSARLRRTKRAIKAVLLDQRIVAGVGNIYADEALFLAGLRPVWRSHALSSAEHQRLFAAIPRVLEKGIRFGGTTLRDYIDSDGRRGSNQEELMVYGRAGKACFVCQTPIKRVIVAQRSSCFCPMCQRRPNPHSRPVRPR